MQHVPAYVSLGSPRCVRDPLSLIEHYAAAIGSKLLKVRE
jgi:hypothetical protein